MSTEIWDLYNAAGKKTRHTMIRGEEVPLGLYHLVVHIWPVNSKGEYLIQCRAATVSWKPGIWATTGGSALSGETSIAAACRELHEELGYKARAEEMHRIACLRRSNSFCNVYTVLIDSPEEDFVLQPEEVDAVKWCSRDTLLRMIRENTLYNYGDAYYRMLFNYRRPV